MTGNHDGTDTFRTAGTGSAEAPVTGWFEPCTEHRGADADAPCAECGWLATDHTAGLADVITVTRRVAVPLRRAS